VQFTVQLPIPLVFVPTVWKLVGNGGCRALLPFKDVCACRPCPPPFDEAEKLPRHGLHDMYSFQSAPRHKQCRRQSTG
jgi:hypothetical protein